MVAQADEPRDLLLFQSEILGQLVEWANADRRILEQSYRMTAEQLEEPFHATHGFEASCGTGVVSPGIRLRGARAPRGGGGNGRGGITSQQAGERVRQAHRVRVDTLQKTFGQQALGGILGVDVRLGVGGIAHAVAFA